MPMLLYALIAYFVSKNSFYLHPNVLLAFASITLRCVTAGVLLVYPTLFQTEAVSTFFRQRFLSFSLLDMLHACIQ